MTGRAGAGRAGYVSSQAAIQAERAVQRPVALILGAIGQSSTTDAPNPEQATQSAWRLWFPQRPGPWRTAYKTVAGVRMKLKVRQSEFPPSQNGSRGNPFAHGKWVKEWRGEAKRIAEGLGIPPQERVRISAVVHRRALGTADEDNDRGRLKPLVDGLRDAGVIRKDTRQFVEYGACTETRAQIGRCGIELIVEALEPAPGGEG